MRERALPGAESIEVLPVGERAALPAPSDSLEADAHKAAAEAEGLDIRRA